MLKQLVIVLALITAVNTSFACSMFTATKNGKTLTGNNEDYMDPNTRMWTVHGVDGDFGRIYFGFSNMFPQGGMNSAGLVFDGFTAPHKDMNKKGKLEFDGNLIDLIMSKCSTIEEVVSYFDKYASPLEAAQLMFVDKTGNSVIVEGDNYVYKNGDYQVATNFYVSGINDGEESTCERYKLANSMLDTSAVTINNFRKILAAVHNEWAGGGTLYSNIYDHDKLQVYLYLHHNYENVVVIDLMKELKEDEKVVELISMFPPSFCSMKFANQGSLEMKFEEDMNKVWEEKGVTTLLENYQKSYDGYRKIQPLIRKYRQIVEETGVTAETKIHDRILNRIGYKLLNEKKYAEAIQVFEYNVELYPKEWNVYDSLGEAYLKSGDKKKAIKYYRKTLALNPDNPNAREIVNKLDQDK
jgi:tetratricopeptide (TPR) repeat protein